MNYLKPINLMVLGISVILCSCVSVPKWGTESGSPEVNITGSDPQGLVIGRMVAKQWTIEKQTPNLITFERQKLSTANRAIFALGGDTMGIIEGWNVTFIPSGSATRAVLSSVYTNSKDYGKSTNPPSQEAGDEFVTTLSGL